MREITFLKSLGTKLQRRRRELGLTQADLGGSNLSKAAVSQIERGKAWPSLPTLLRLAQRLGLRAADLLLTDEEEAARLEAWNGLLMAVTSPDVPPKAKAQCMTALIRFAEVERLPLPNEQLWHDLADTLAASGDRQDAGAMLAAYGRTRKKRNDPRAADVLLRAVELLTGADPGQ